MTRLINIDDGGTLTDVCVVVGISRIRAASVSVLCGRLIAQAGNTLQTPWSRAIASAKPGAVLGALRA